MSQPQKILVRTPNWLGDLMVATAFLRRLLKAYPKAQIDLLVKKGFEQVPLPGRGEVIPYSSKEQGVWSMAQELRERRYDRAYLLSPSYSSALMAFLARIPERYGLAGQWGRSLLLRPTVTSLVPPKGQHLSAEYHQLLTASLGIEEIGSEPGLPGLSLAAGWAEGLLTGPLDLEPGFVALAPGAIYGEAKRWPYQSYLELIHRLSEAGERVVVLGQEGDFPFDLTQGKNLTGATGLLELIALLSRAKLLVSNDSGAMHIMAALRRPQVAIFGSTSTLWTSPTNPKARVVSLHVDCSPCFKRRCPYGHYKCLTGIGAELVFEAYLDALSEPPGPSPQD
ncbi:MAG: lipopolysaccharide heptosyltransferase II [Candidatus Lambdaproteobacteria bacterium RIFOXYD1_FULL_56_27]|uniref:lipopolysaccharide heptosyltransferase II n=1 Tax=Candidatus Lambdaproteobacteria bacterium RIFOXYD2_FULL_56_26 TaxID=1817773 RepID=A0A1F6GSB5_9PROT|nr:MAG: lipopolysaccharide heptosyltransferase II [Candidatus Lambdaproteobacteria bacterium RIFOXYD2_FULL_56_26]OGH01346.1 MAG: lipopolysaccharide heptosyltransferase II [Candidatus Lambdaproteobacteria bacterium RIFOXYC1_FULL_56_13]OGH06887.1 MAG: lipopolysaccharide heptosyltransferase II [Candidatus Lambdaproteobacteria bacterium RIFOXYD1_FULL_56_27]